MKSSVQHKSTLVLLIILLSMATSVLTFWFSTRAGRWTDSPVKSELSADAAPLRTSTAIEQGADTLTLTAATRRIDELEVMLSQEQHGRLMLQRVLDDHEKRIDQLMADLQELSHNRTTEGEPEATVNAQRSEVAEDNRRAQSELGTGAGFRTPTTAAALVAAGVDETIALDLIARQDSRALAELELRDQAAREGWLDAEDFAERLEASLPEQINLRDVLEPEQWDQYLYASGRPNRVTITGVLTGSAAYNALLQTGDRLLSYAGQPIYRIGDLQDGTRGGNRGELIVIRVLRGKDVLELTVPRGPLGVNLSPERIDPNESGINP